MWITKFALVVVLIFLSFNSKASDTNPDFNYAKLTDVWNTSIDLHEAGKNADTNGITDQEFETKYINAAQDAAKEYFTSAKIKFESLGNQKMPINIGTADKFVSVRSEPLYLTGSPDGDSTSRLIYSIVQAAKKAGLEAKVLYMPLHEFINKSAAAQFNPATVTITIDGFSLYYRAFGGSDAFAHEAQHLFSFAKMHQGDQTLSRFSMSESNSTEQIYGAFFNLDEIEAYMLELRYFNGPAKRARAKVAKIQPSSVEIFEDYAKSSKSFVESVLENLFSRAEAVLDRMSKNKNSNSFIPNSGHFPGSEHEYTFTFTPGFTSTDSATAKYNAVGRPLKKDTSFAAITSSLKTEIAWAQARLHQLKAEYKELKRA